MKISLNWIKQFIDFELPPVDELVERIGAQLGAVEEVESLGEKYQGAVVVKVVECGKLENSDHLNRCLIDDGGKVQGVERDEHGLVQVITGAPNVHQDMLAVWLPPGTTVPESYGKDPFVLQSRPMRGSMSHGMLASARELSLSDEHEGILEIDKNATPGDDFVNVYKLDDYVIDIENKMFTHRPDCFGALGVAREIAGILQKSFNSPEWYRPSPEFPGKSANLPLKVTNELPELVPRFSAITIADVQLGPSPEWLEVALAKVGQKSINNIVDLTNFYMLVTGQPLHAYDYDKVRALTGNDTAEITVRHPRSGEKIKLLNGKEIEPRREAIMIASGEHLIGVGGVMGGSETEVGADTKNIILEAANFDMYSIRRTSMAHGLFTDAVTRFNKGQSPLQTLAVLAKITDDVQKMAGGKVASELIDIGQVGKREWVHPPVPVSAGFINDRLGLKLSADEMKQLLGNVEFSVELDGDKLTVTAPFWRTDIETREDVVEEVGRLYGFDKLPLDLPKRSIKPVKKDKLLELKQQIRENLVKSGANEVLTYSFVHGNLFEKVGQDSANAFRVSNALSPDLQYYRLSLTPSLLANVHPNIKAGYEEFAIFELGKTHDKSVSDEDGLPIEFDNLALIYAAQKSSRSGAAYYEARKYLVNLAAEIGAELEFAPLSHHVAPADAPFDLARTAIVRLKGSTEGFGIVGELTAKASKALKLPEKVAAFEIGIGALLKTGASSTYVPLPRFPKVTQDITLKVPVKLPYQELYDFVWNELTKVRPEQTLPTLGPLDMYQKEDDVAHKQITFRLTIASYERTLTDQEVSKLLDTVAVAAKDKLGAERL